MGQFIKELYDREDSVHDALACDFITEMLDIPGVREAVLIEAMKDESWFGIRENGLEQVSDIPFQWAWDHIMNRED